MPDSIEQRIAKLDWASIATDLDAAGYALTGPLLVPLECENFIQSYKISILFRNRIIMSRHNFGRGEYQYFAYPLPDIVQALRTGLYPPLARIANRWRRILRISNNFPNNHETYLATCHGAGQSRPTPLLLKYGPEDHNCLHRDLYGKMVFPLQVAFLLDAPDSDFTGGEFVLTEQRPRMQSRVEVVPLARGEGVIFPVDERPVEGTRGPYRARMRHGVSRVRTGQRHTLGIIFHDAA